MSDVVKEDWLRQVSKGEIKGSCPSLNPPHEYHVYIASAKLDPDKASANSGKASAQPDSEFAQKLYDALDACGFKVFLPAVDVMLGEDELSAQAEAIKISRRVVVVQTENSINDNYSRYEVNQACYNMVNNGLVTVIPILKGTSRNDIPVRIKYVNFVDTENKDCWFQELCQHLIAPDVKLQDKLPFVNIGEAAAWMMFQSFLRNMLLTLSDDIKKLCAECRIPEEKTCSKFIVIIPESGRCPVHFRDEDPNVDFVSGLCDIMKPRAGDSCRKLTRSMHKVRDTTTNEWYYFTGEFAGSVQTMHDIMMAGRPGLTTEQLPDQVVRFAVTLEQLADFEETKQYAENLIILRYKFNGETQSLSDLLLQCIKDEIAGRGTQ